MKRSIGWDCQQPRRREETPPKRTRNEQDIFPKRFGERILLWWCSLFDVKQDSNVTRFIVDSTTSRSFVVSSRLEHWCGVGGPECKQLLFPQKDRDCEGKDTEEPVPPKVSRFIACAQKLMDALMVSGFEANLTLTWHTNSPVKNMFSLPKKWVCKIKPSHSMDGCSTLSIRKFENE